MPRVKFVVAGKREPLIVRINIALGPYFPVPPLLGGAIETTQLALAEQFAARGNGVTVFSRRYGDLPNDEIRNGVRHIRVASRNAPTSRILYRLYDIIYSRRVAKEIANADVTVTNSVFLPLALRGTCGGAIYVHVGRYPKGQLRLYQHVARLQTPSSAVAEAIRHKVPAMADRISIIPYPLTGPLAATIPKEQLAVKRPNTILYVGRIAREKGVHVLIEAFVAHASGALAGYRLKIVGSHEVARGGDGPEYLAALKELAAPASASIEFEGFVPYGPALRHVFETADIFVYPSLAEHGESFGLAPLEAMAAGCRVLVSDLACFRDYLSAGINGEVFDHRHDPAGALGTALAAMVMNRDPLPMRQAAVETAKQFQLGPIADLFLKDFTAIIDRKKTT